jgi:hypothetical protein
MRARLCSTGRPQLHPQGYLLPQGKGLLIEPIPSPRLVKLKIEIEQHSCQNKSHLDIGQVSAHTVPRTDREWLQDVSVVVAECRITIVEEAFGDERVWEVEV